MLQQFYPQPNHPYRFELNKDMHFAAAHFIPDERAGICRHTHGHTYFVNITVAGDELNDSGFLVNFQKLKELVHGKYDHTLLNDADDFRDDDPEHFPTTEVVARTIWERVQTVLNEEPNRPVCVQVVVRETPTSYVIYRPKQEDIKR